MAVPSLYCILLSPCEIIDNTFLPWTWAFWRCCLKVRDNQIRAVIARGFFASAEGEPWRTMVIGRIQGAESFLVC